MGAAATVETRTSTITAQTKNSTVPICCEACKIPLGIFKRKKCVVCLKIHCSRCLSSRPTHFDSRSACVKCHSLVAGDYTRDYLMTCFTVSELREFLLRHHVVTGDHMDKKDLIELMMQRRRPSTSRHGIREEEEQRVSPLRDQGPARSAQDQGSTRSASTPSFAGTSDNSHGHMTTNNRDVFEHDMSHGSSRRLSNTPDEPNAASYINPNRNSTNTRLDVSDSSSSASPNSGVRRHTIANDSDVSKANSELPVRRRITLADIGSHQDIKKLNIRQLKDILVNNYVDYKGCCERQELVDRVILLWTDHERMKLTVDSSDGHGSGKDIDLCKICMDSAIDCILLECGHMVSCTLCGKQLAECPICRHVKEVRGSKPATYSSTQASILSRLAK